MALLLQHPVAKVGTCASWGSAAWGGRYPGALPPGVRAASAGAAVAYGSAAFALSHPTVPERTAQTIARVCVGVGVLGTVANALSTSRAEKPWALWSAALAATSWRNAWAARSAAADHYVPAA